MKYSVIKPFRYSLDGITLKDANEGDVVEDLPQGTTIGLLAEEYIAPVDDDAEYQAALIAATPNAAPVEDLRAMYREKFGRKPHPSMSDDSIRRKLAE